MMMTRIGQLKDEKEYELPNKDWMEVMWSDGRMVGPVFSHLQQWKFALLYKLQSMLRIMPNNT